ncbi:uncharacterized protein DUF3850 [Orbus hercynius]|uniref:Uncharacterized protein DUF3850 n=1 Tax=Orbus hercynius TaxID=593135 RepID=A0A495RID8_9GAMM|nr:DUF3850 domain-containing protein [Orbus hercynius]RKS87292.1 uncharacterized protein DUF3850 [Orbus hercynius]
MTIHELKILPEYFNAVKSGVKKFECRINDRDYRSGDILHLREWQIKYTGNDIKAKVTYILSDEQFTKPSMVIMSIEVIK